MRDREILDESGGHKQSFVFNGVIQADGEEAGFQLSRAEQRLLGKGHAPDSEEFLGVDGLIDGDDVGPTAGDGFGVFHADDRKRRGRKTVLAGILGGAGLAFGHPRTGRCRAKFVIVIRYLLVRASSCRLSKAAQFPGRRQAVDLDL